MKEAKTILGTISLVLYLIFIAVCASLAAGMVEAQSIDRPVIFNDHPQHAAYVILPYGGGTAVAQGEQITGFPSPALPVSLGEVARQYRAMHESVPKSKCVWEGQCISRTCYLRF